MQFDKLHLWIHTIRLSYLSWRRNARSCRLPLSCKRDYWLLTLLIDAEVPSCFARWTGGPSRRLCLDCFWSKAAGRTRYPFSLRNQLVQTNTSLSPQSHTSQDICQPLKRNICIVSDDAIHQAGPVSRPGNKQRGPLASLFIIKDDVAEAGAMGGAVNQVHLRCPVIRPLFHIS